MSKSDHERRKRKLLEKEKTNRRRASNHVRKARSDISKELILYFSNPWVYLARQEKSGIGCGQAGDSRHGKMASRDIYRKK